MGSIPVLARLILSRQGTLSTDPPTPLGVTGRRQLRRVINPRMLWAGFG
jgi:hypothetical protein